MIPEEILFSLYNLRTELEREAILKYKMGIGLPYTDELREIDKQIEEINKRLPPSSFSSLLSLEKEKFPLRIGSDGQNLGSQSLTEANKKKLCVLKKIKEEWDLAGFDTLIPDSRYNKWIRECGLEDYPRLKDILTTFQEEGLIVSFRNIPQFV